MDFTGKMLIIFQAEVAEPNCQRDKKQVLAWIWTKGSPWALLVGIQTGVDTVEGSMEVPPKIKNKITI